jgi:hypothetical protein
MPRYTLRLLVPALLGLLFLVPALATAGPDHKDAVRSTAEDRKGTPSLLSRLQEFLSVLWAENGSILDPDGAGPGTSSRNGTGENPASSGDNGSILDPDGRL